MATGTKASQSNLQSKSVEEQTRPAKKRLSMHEGIADWSDPICVCEAEPYWAEVAEEMGIDIRSDREQDD